MTDSMTDSCVCVRMGIGGISVLPRRHGHHVRVQRVVDQELREHTQLDPQCRTASSREHQQDTRWTQLSFGR